jgi:hypothetical protein
MINAMLRATSWTLRKLVGLTPIICSPTLAAPVGAGTALPYQEDSRHVLYGEEPRIIWLEPRLIKRVDPDRWVMASKGAVIAVEVVAVPQARLTNPVRIELPEEFGGDLPVATQFSQRLKGMRQDACLMRSGRSASEAFVQVCLADSNHDGWHDVALRGDKSIGIEPVHLAPAVPPDEARSKIQRKIVLDRIEGGRLALSIRYVINSRGNYCSVGPSERARAPSEGRPGQGMLLLRQNSAATAEGLRLKMHKVGAHWWINAQGSFPAWATLTDAGTAVDAGGKMDCIR